MDERVQARPLDKGMGVAIGRRTVFRPSDEEDMGRVADRVAYGNASLSPESVTLDERLMLRNAIATGALITSGRHLQHGDDTQATRPMEVFTNCSSAAASFAKFYLLLNGSGVGRSYDDHMMAVDWDKAPKLKLVMSESHQDYPRTNAQLVRYGIEFGVLPFGSKYDGLTTSQLDAVKAFRDEMIDTTLAAFTTPEERESDIHAGGYHWKAFRVPDSREGWARALELYEAMAYSEQSDVTLILDFSDVRPNGAPIGGMQDRPASGPLSVMRAFDNIRRHVVGKGMDLWKQAMYVDHYLSVEVQVGGARRAARMSTKSYKDNGAFEFVRIKADNGLWTSNNSLVVDAEFWDAVAKVQHAAEVHSHMDHADIVKLVETSFDEFTLRCWHLFNAATESMWVNGEPGFINGDKLESVETGKARERQVHTDGSGFGSLRYRATYAAGLLQDVENRGITCDFPMITNPCGEIELHVNGAYCVIGDLAPFNAIPFDYTGRVAGILSEDEMRDWDLSILESAELCSRFLIRVNMMDSLYRAEVERTNRIGVSLTGIHEWAWFRYGFSFRDLIDERKSAEFWNFVGMLSQHAKDAADSYAMELGVELPHTITTIKPAGTTSKLYGLTEGAHLPARRQYVRWVQFKGQKDEAGGWMADADPLLSRYEDKGYPVRELTTFPGMSIVGFPTVPLVCRLGMGDDLVTASEATPEEQYQWLRLLEKYWIGGSRGNSISYTLKVLTDRCDLDDFKRLIVANQPLIRCASVLPTKPDHEMGFEYLPEEEVGLDAFKAIVDHIHDDDLRQEIDMNTLLCASGACPI